MLSTQLFILNKSRSSGSPSGIKKYTEFSPHTRHFNGKGKCRVCTRMSQLHRIMTDTKLDLLVSVKGSIIINRHTAIIEWNKIFLHVGAITECRDFYTRYTEFTYRNSAAFRARFCDIERIIRGLEPTFEQYLFPGHNDRTAGCGKSCCPDYSILNEITSSHSWFLFYEREMQETAIPV